MISEKIRTNANLYLNNSTNQFFCVTQEFEEDGSKSFYTPIYHPEAYLVFGCESKGLPTSIRENMKDRIFSLPIKNKAVKSLNLANTATAVVYQAMRDYL